MKSITVYRLLEYYGPESWVKDTLDKSYVRPETSPMGSGRSIKEIVCWSPQDESIKKGGENLNVEDKDNNH